MRALIGWVRHWLRGARRLALGKPQDNEYDHVGRPRPWRG